MSFVCNIPAEKTAVFRTGTWKVRCTSVAFDSWKCMKRCTTAEVLPVLVTFPALKVSLYFHGPLGVMLRSNNSANDEFAESAIAGRRSKLIRMTSFACDRRGFTLAAAQLAWGKRVTGETPNGLCDSEFLVDDDCSDAKSSPSNLFVQKWISCGNFFML